jgi:hypothetical protein
MAPDLKNESYFTFDKNAQPERFRSDSQDRRAFVSTRP